MDHGAGTGLIGAAFATARSFQPNLLTRRSTDQAIISGATAAAAYGLFSAGDSVIDSIASRFNGVGRDGQVNSTARLAVAAAVGVAGTGAAYLLRWREHESRNRALARLAAETSAAVAAASIGSGITSTVRPNAATAATIATATLVGVGSWASTKPWDAHPGSLAETALPGAIKSGDEYFLEDTVREVSPIQAAGIGAAVAVITYGLARGESLLTERMSRGAALVLGGEAADHRALGRITAAAATIAFGWFAISQASGLLSKGGASIEPGHSEQPQAPEISGSPASGLPWTKMTREGARWLSMALEPATIDSVMGTTGAKQPIRVYASLDLASNEQERADILLAEIDRTRALERSVFVLFSATGSGYVNYVANETVEYLTGGDCASACIQYSVLPSALSLGDVPTGTAQTQMVMHGIVERLLAIPAEKRPRFYLFGESLGSQVSEEMFRDTGILGLAGTGLDGALWIGTPAATVWRRQLWGTRTVAEAPEVGPGEVYLPRNLVDWRALPDSEREKVRFLLLMNGDDPIPKFGPQLAWRKPDWLGPDDKRPFGAPRGTRWLPGMTYLTTFFDMQNALVPTPGVFSEGGHDYRHVLPTAISQTWRLPMTAEQHDRMWTALQQRELAWELHRDWTAALTKPGHEQDAATAKALEKASKYVGHPVDEAELHTIIETGLQPR